MIGAAGLAGAWDVAVAGAGPAGSTTAALLASRGLRVLLIERARFPREKPCSDYVAPGARPALRRLDLLEEVERRAVPVTAIEVTGPRGAIMRGAHEGQGGFGLPRRELDQLLVDRAVAWGAVLWEGAKAEAAVRCGRRITGLVVRREGRREVVEAGLLVGADGLRSVVARALGGGRRVGPRRLALVAQVARISGLHAAGEMFVTRRGYAGVAPLPDGVANVAVVLPIARIPRRVDPATLFWEELDQVPGLRDRVRSGRLVREVLTTGPFGWQSRRVTADGSMLVGDAASFFDPFTGDGTTAALVGGCLAADAAAPVLARGEPVTARSLASYRAARRRAFFGRWSAQRFVGAAITRPLVFDTLLRPLASWPALAGRVVGVAAGVGRLGPACALRTHLQRQV